MKTVRELPNNVIAKVPVQEGPPCHKCSAMCCKYYALELDEPEDRDDFEALKWYLIHDKSWIWVDGDEWYLQVDSPCRHLGPNNECTIYEKRPQICRDYGMPENLEDPDEPLCDYFAQDSSHDLEFRDIDSLEAYAAKFLAKEEEKRKRRSDAAKRAWRKRKATL